MSIDHIKTHKYIAAREKHPKGIIVTVGYAGNKKPPRKKEASLQSENSKSQHDYYLTLYPEKNSPGYYLIPADAIVDHECHEKECDNDGRVTLYIKANAVIQYEQPIEARHLKANNEPFDDGRPEVIPYHPPVGRGCFEACLRNIANDRSNFRFSQSAGHIIRRTLNDKGMAKLRACLYACGYRGTHLETMVAAGIKRLNTVKDVYVPQYKPNRFYHGNVSPEDRIRALAEKYNAGQNMGF